MDSQRFDLSKRRKPSHHSIATNATLGHDDSDDAAHHPQYIVDLSSALDSSWDVHAMTTLSATTSRSDETATQKNTHDQDHTDLDHSTASSSTTLATPGTVYDPKKETEYTDVFERDGYTTVRTIIRPRPPFFNLNIFARAPETPADSRPRSLPPTPCAHGFRLGSLNCMASTDAFEEQLDFIQQARDRELRGENIPIQIRLHQSRHVVVEERWRRPVEALVYHHAQAPKYDVAGGVEASYY